MTTLDTNTITIFLPILPPSGTAQQRKINIHTGHTYLPRRVQAARKAFDRALIPHRRKVPLSGPLSVTQRWHYPFPKNRRRKGAEFEPKITAPDSDNISKLLGDACTRAGIWADDRLIYSLTIEKYWVNPSVHPVGIELTITYQKQENQA